MLLFGSRRLTPRISSTLIITLQALIKAKDNRLPRVVRLPIPFTNTIPCGYLIEETDPRGYVTYRDYDPLGRIKAETKEDHTTLFSYEAGGLLETHHISIWRKLTRHYTTNGLLKEEIYPDGTKNTISLRFLWTADSRNEE
jgi:YD repeat-containing protein